MENIFRGKDFLLSCGPSNVHKFAFGCDLSILLLLIEMNFIPEIIGCGVEILGCRPTVLTRHGMTRSLFQFILFFLSDIRYELNLFLCKQGSKMIFVFLTFRSCTKSLHVYLKIYL